MVCESTTLVQSRATLWLKERKKDSGGLISVCNSDAKQTAPFRGPWPPWRDRGRRRSRTGPEWWAAASGGCPFHQCLVTAAAHGAWNTYIIGRSRLAIVYPQSTRTHNAYFKHCVNFGDRLLFVLSNKLFNELLLSNKLFNELFYKQLSVGRTLGLFQRQHWGNFWEMGWSTHGDDDELMLNVLRCHLTY